MKRILAIILSVVMLIGCVAVSISATEEPTAANTAESGKALVYPAANSKATDADPASALAIATGNKGESFYNAVRRGDTFEISVYVKDAGTYYLSAGAAFADASPSFSFTVDGEEYYEKNTVAGTDYRTWFTTTPVAVEMTEGWHTILATTKGWAACLYSINVAAEGTTPVYPTDEVAEETTAEETTAEETTAEETTAEETTEAPSEEEPAPEDESIIASADKALVYPAANSKATDADPASALAIATGNKGESFYNAVRRGDTFEISVYVKDAGTYYLSAGAAFADASPSFSFTVDGVEYYEANTVAGTDYRTWFTTTPVAVEMTEGWHTILATTKGWAACLYSINVAAEGTTPVYPTDEVIVDTYIYINSLDGEILYNKTVDLAEVDDAMLAKLNAYANDEYNKFVEFEEISCEEGVHTFYSVHNTEADVVVNGGKKEDKNGYSILTAVVPEGQYFAGWYDGDTLISYDETYKFFPDEEAESITAKYTATAPVKETAVQVEADREADKLTVKVTPVDGEETIVNFGYYIATSATTMDAEAVKAANRVLESEAPHAYMVRNHNILETTQDQNIYLVGFYTYVDGNGETQTVYTELIIVAPLLLADESPDYDIGESL